ncbi:MAG: NAD(P)/FAD-dependent oxidoreductase [Rhodospirillales bacterium]|nr:NAD(P)/FAD-dependent oxidoreductase [Rhodospirillales bacterium]MDE0379477.1 NAD(P)/FAD-dependent oxidoreductase [Rhodospirillales bacterium]
MVVGARCAGAPTAMLLARRGYRVLLLDRDRFPSDMGQSTHLIHPLGAAHLRDWGVLPQIAARAAPFTGWRVDLHGTVLQGAPPAVDGCDDSYGPRRYLLDSVLAEAAVASGAEFRDGARVAQLVEDDGRVAGVVIAGAGGSRQVERARLVIGADGPNSVVARSVGAKESLCEPIVQSNIWSYWEGIALDHVRLYIREHKGAFAFPASDGTVLVAANLMHDEFVAARHDREAAFLARVEEVAPDLRAMLPGAKRVEEFHGGCTRAFVREAAGPGWALTGDAGMKKDPVTAQGISTAFHCAEMLAEAVDDGLSGRRPLDEALAGYHEARDDWLLPYYRFTAQLARFARPSETLATYYRRIQDDPAETARLFGAVTLTHSPDDVLPAA